MKYYAVTEDPRELYHYGVKGMKWGQHLFGDKPKSPAYHKAAKKLKDLTTKAAKATASSVKTVGKTVQKSAGQMLYNARAAQEKRFNKAVERSQKRYDKIDKKIDNYYANKRVKDAKREATREAVASVVKSGIEGIQKTAGQISYNIRRKQQEQYQNAVKKSQQRNDMSRALRSLDQENKDYMRANRERKMDDLREKHADIMADNDLKSMQKAVKVERNMPKYYQEARTGMLKYGKLSDEQIGRLQNRLVLEAQTRRLGSTEAPSWRQQKKMARREGYLQGITKGVAAGMEEIGRASVQYGIKNLANRKKLDSASEQKAQREKEANRIKNKKTHSEMREDIRDKAYESQLKEGVHAIQRGSLTARGAAAQLRYAERKQRERQDVIDDAREERKFLREENQSVRKEDRLRQQRLTEAAATADEIGKQLHEVGYAIIPQLNKDGKKIGMKVLTADGGGKDKNGNDINEGRAYLTLYRSKYKLDEPPETKSPNLGPNGVDSRERDRQIIELAEEKRRKELEKERAEHAEKVDRANAAHLATEKRRKELEEQAEREKKSVALAKELQKGLKEYDKQNSPSKSSFTRRIDVEDIKDLWNIDPRTGEVKPRKPRNKGSSRG